MKIYCLNCLHGSDYTSSKPSHCEKCKKPYVSANLASIQPIVVKSTPKKAQFQRPEPEESENIEEEYQEIPEIEQIKFKLSQELRPNRHEFKRDMEGTGDANRARKPHKPAKGKRKTKRVSESQAQNVLQSSFNQIKEQYKDSGEE